MKEFEKHVKETASKMLNDLVRETPKKTGFARGNWSFHPFGATSVATLKPTASKAEVAQAEAMSLASFNSFLGSPVTSFSFANNASYLQELEEGKSTQAPAGFIASIVSRYK
jgi:hypothetical protein